MGVGGIRACESLYKSKERVYGALFLSVGVFLLKVYIVSFFGKMLPLPSGLKRVAARLHSASVELPVLALVVVFLFIVIRIGWNMLTAPPAKSLEDQENSLRRG